MRILREAISTREESRSHHLMRNTMLKWTVTFCIWWYARGAWGYKWHLISYLCVNRLSYLFSRLLIWCLIKLFLLFIWLVHDNIGGNIIDVKRSFSTLLRWCCLCLLIIQRAIRQQTTFLLLSLSCAFWINSLDKSRFLWGLELSLHVILSLSKLSFTMLNLFTSIIFDMFSPWRFSI